MDNKNGELTITVSGMNAEAERIILKAQMQVQQERSREREKTYRTYRDAYRSHEAQENDAMMNAYRLMNNMKTADLVEAFFGAREANIFRAQSLTINIFTLWGENRRKAKRWFLFQIKKLDGYLDFFKKTK